MKKITITLVLFLATLTSFAEKTTVEDYNYLTKGLKFQLENGLGIKQGYDLKEIGKFDNDKEKCKIWAFYKKDNETEIRAVLITIESDNQVTYLCMPTQESDTEILQASYDSIKQLPKSQITLIAFALAYIGN